MTTARPPKKLPLVPILIGLGVVALIAAVLLTMSGGDDAQAQYGDPVVTGSALPAAGGSPDAALGLPIPEVVGADFEGTPVRIESDGRPKILLFLAHWCPHCQAEVPVVQDWVAAGNLPPGLDLIAVATSTTSSRDNFPPSEWLEREEWQVPTLVDDSAYTVAAAFGLDAFPFWVFVSPEGFVVGRTSGRLDAATITEVAMTLVGVEAKSQSLMGTETNTRKPRRPTPLGVFAK